MNSNRSKLSEKDPEMLGKYGSLFYEVSDDQGLLASFYYFFFFTKRLLFILILLSLLDYPIVQVVLIIILNAFVSFM